MRTPNLQYLYLQKPVTFVVILCIISILPWILPGDSPVNGEAYEVAAAISILDSGNWILPAIHANEFVYSSPLVHWLIAAVSYPQGYVSELTARLPSAIAFVVLVAYTLMFYGKRIRFQQAFISSLFLLTCLEMHRAGIIACADMLLTTFMALALFRLYKWEESLYLKGLPVIIPFFLSCAILTKGLAVAVIPLLVFVVYLLVLGKYRLLTIFKSVLYVGVASMFLPLLWYIAAWKQGGDAFLDMALAENFGYFFKAGSPAINYELGQESGFWCNFLRILAGFMPWTILFIFSLFGIKLSRPGRSLGESLRAIWTGFRSLDKVLVFSVTALACIILFYLIPGNMQNVYLMPAYPFLALFFAQYALYLTEYRRLVTRFFAGFMVSVVSIALLVIGLVIGGALDAASIAGQLTNSPDVIGAVRYLSGVFTSPDGLTLSVLFLNIFAAAIVWYQLFKKINIKILYSAIGLAFVVNMLIDRLV